MKLNLSLYFDKNCSEIFKKLKHILSFSSIKTILYSKVSQTIFQTVCLIEFKKEIAPWDQFFHLQFRISNVNLKIPKYMPKSFFICSSSATQDHLILDHRHKFYNRLPFCLLTKLKDKIDLYYIFARLCFYDKLIF